MMVEVSGFRVCCVSFRRDYTRDSNMNGLKSSVRDLHYPKHMSSPKPLVLRCEAHLHQLGERCSWRDAAGQRNWVAPSFCRMSKSTALELRPIGVCVLQCTLIPEQVSQLNPTSKKTG